MWRVQVRPLTQDDVHAADEVAWTALSPLIPEEFRSDEDEQARALRGRPRIAHLVETDPDGCWAAEDDAGLAGICLALRREDVWGLSLFAMRADLQGRGHGRRLLARGLDYGEGTRGGIILSSTHPAAMRSYARAGFRLHPCVAAAGPLNASRIPDGLRSRPGDPEADRATIDRASRHARGATHAPDVAFSVGTGQFALLVCEDRGYAMYREGSPALLAAVDEEAATDLLWSCFATAAPGTSVHWDFATAGQDWAVAVALEAGLSLTPDGPVFVRGTLGAMAPYLPSGAWL
jgi:GNAT superfamily N-acetyltransferase